MTDFLNDGLASPLTDRTSATDDQRIENIMPLPPPMHLIQFFPIKNTPVEAFISETRHNVRAIVHGVSDRLLVVIG
ncbi:MAG: 3-deoxy-7-phosphoheptulonate synthase, partial [Candidatus Contendobacter sp.]|nr:3-deoxy-7-phosphoheptulonate synthase [Candidatus Contendobacter sp.]